MQPRFRSLWERYCRGVQAIVYVVDAADHEAVKVRSVVCLLCATSRVTLQGPTLNCHLCQCTIIAAAERQSPAMHQREIATAAPHAPSPAYRQVLLRVVTLYPFVSCRLLPRSCMRCLPSPAWMALRCWCWGTRMTCQGRSARSS
jgi:hypothetical protein